MSHVFISFSKHDTDFAHEVSAQIKSRANLDTWLYTDKLPAGEHWRSAIDEALKDCYALVLVLTPYSRNSQYVAYEWAVAIGLGKPVIPIMLTDTENLHPKLTVDIQWEDFRTEHNWERFVRNLREEVETYTAYTIRVPRNAPKVIHNTVALLDSAAPNERSLAIQQLAEMNHPSINMILMEALRFVSLDVCLAAAEALGKRKATEASTSLIEMLSHSSWQLRQGAAIALARIGDKAGVDELLNILQDPDMEGVDKAIYALGELRDPNTIDVISKYIRHPHNIQTRIVAAKALGKFKEPAVSLLWEQYKPNKHVEVRAEILRSLAAIGSKAALEYLKEAAKDENQLLLIIDLLIEIKYPLVIPILTDLARTHQTSKSVKQRIVTGLRKMKSAKAVKASDEIESGTF